MDTAAQEPEVHERAHPSPLEYVKIAIVLALLTAGEVTVSYAHMARGLQILLLLSMMAVKFALVVLWFMHLRFDDARYSRFFIMGFSGACILFLVVLLLFKAFA